MAKIWPCLFSTFAQIKNEIEFHENDMSALLLLAFFHFCRNWEKDNMHLICLLLLFQFCVKKKWSEIERLIMPRNANIKSVSIIVQWRQWVFLTNHSWNAHLARVYLHCTVLYTLKHIHTSVSYVSVYGIFSSLFKCNTIQFDSKQ